MGTICLMTDWRRMEWQYWANRWATLWLCLLILAQAPEVVYALKYHFPWWEEVTEIVQIPLTYACWFIKRHTDMYRIDL